MTCLLSAARTGRAVSGMALLLAPIGLAAQRPGGAQAGKVPSPVASYQVEVQSFTMTPAQPRAGDNVTFQLTLRNSGTTAPSAVPWLIALQGGAQMVGQGTTGAFAAGATQTVTATWRAVAGSHAALGTVAPPGISTALNAALPSAKAKDLLFNVASVSASSVGSSSNGPVTQQLLDWNKARVAGARFADGKAQAACRALLTGADTDPYRGTNMVLHGVRGLVVAHLQCMTPLGGRMNPEFFDFTLRNGWRVKSFDISQPQSNPQQNGWQVLVRPTLGSDRPYTKLAMWANGVSALTLTVEIWIEGPAGTDPYQ
ncbi:MAG: hypothetical protein IPF87_15985 [Gemmatimonadetes bacterium]|nr:hypothetical protein [Gemmatimonadota bacterium]